MVGCCKRRDNGFHVIKVYFSGAVQAGGRVTLLPSDAGPFQLFLLQCILPLGLPSSLWQEGREEAEGKQFSFKEMLSKQGTLAII